MDPVRKKAYDRLNELIEETDRVDYNHGDLSGWTADVKAALNRLFGLHSSQLDAFDSVHYAPLAFFTNTPDSVFEQSHYSGVDQAKSLLLSYSREIRDYELEIDKQDFALTKRPQRAGRKVFIVHGHDEAMKSSVARFLERLDLEPIILHEATSSGRTVIEKIEAHSDASFAIVLLSPDDSCEAKSEQDQMLHRARQNVILELGYFIGVLGRERVCPLVKGRLELPSDFSGVVYVSYEADWKLQLVRELKGAGINIDANKAF